MCARKVTLQVIEEQLARSGQQLTGGHSFKTVLQASTHAHLCHTELLNIQIRLKKAHNQETSVPRLHKDCHSQTTLKYKGNQSI